LETKERERLKLLKDTEEGSSKKRTRYVYSPFTLALPKNEYQDVIIFGNGFIVKF